MMGFVKEFRDFAMKGNIVDLAVAVIIGAAFGSIVSSLVDDIITPLLLTPALKAVGASNIAELHYGTIKYGNFLAAVIKFVIVAIALFSIIKLLNSMKKKEEVAAPAEPSLTDKLLMDIRDSLRR